MNTLVESLDIAFASVNEDMISRELAWFEERYTAFRELKAKRHALWESARKEGGEAWIEYHKTSDQHLGELIHVSGGKGNYNHFIVSNLKGSLERAHKDVLNKIAKRNIKIAKKLTDKGVGSINPEASNVTRTSDGYVGHYKVMTDKGLVNVEIRIILAGGYNIQKLHVRCLVNVHELEAA